MQWRRACSGAALVAFQPRARQLKPVAQQTHDPLSRPVIAALVSPAASNSRISSSRPVNEGNAADAGDARIAPLGAYFADRPREAALQAVASAEVTHAHPEGAAGAVLVTPAWLDSREPLPEWAHR
jgi:ADP-ribosylglycohydrolase